MRLLALLAASARLTAADTELLGDCVDRADLCGVMRPGSCLLKGECISNAMGVLKHQPDNNLVFYDWDGFVQASSNTDKGCSTTHFCYQVRVCVCVKRVCAERVCREGVQRGCAERVCREGVQNEGVQNEGVQNEGVQNEG